MFGVGLRFCLSTKLPGDLNAAGPGISLWPRLWSLTAASWNLISQGTKEAIWILMAPISLPSTPLCTNRTTRYSFLAWYTPQEPLVCLICTQGPLYSRDCKTLTSFYNLWSYPRVSSPLLTIASSTFSKHGVLVLGGLKHKTLKVWIGTKFFSTSPQQNYAMVLAEIGRSPSPTQSHPDTKQQHWIPQVPCRSSSVYHHL